MCGEQRNHILEETKDGIKPVIISKLLLHEPMKRLETKEVAFWKRRTTTRSQLLFNSFLLQNKFKWFIVKAETVHDMYGRDIIPRRHYISKAVLRKSYANVWRAKKSHSGRDERRQKTSDNFKTSPTCTDET
jgi:hypothetical protein